MSWKADQVKGLCTHRPVALGGAVVCSVTGACITASVVAQEVGTECPDLGLTAPAAMCVSVSWRLCFASMTSSSMTYQHSKWGMAGQVAAEQSSCAGAPSGAARLALMGVVSGGATAAFW